MEKNFLSSKTIQGLVLTILGLVWHLTGWQVDDATTTALATNIVTFIGIVYAIYGRCATKGEKLKVGKANKIPMIVIACFFAVAVCSLSACGLFSTSDSTTTSSTTSYTLPANCLDSDGNQCDSSVILSVINKDKLTAVRNAIATACDAMILAGTLSDSIDVTQADVVAVITAIKEFCENTGTYTNLATLISSHVTDTQVTTILTTAGSLPLWSNFKAATGNIAICDKTLIIRCCNYLLNHYGASYDLDDGVTLAEDSSSTE